MVWFVTVSGLSEDLATLALIPTRVLVPLPAISVLLSFQRAILIQGRKTRPITIATATEVAVIALLFVACAWALGLVGVTAAFVAFVGGRCASNLYLAPVFIRRPAACVPDRPQPGTGLVSKRSGPLTGQAARA